MGGTRATHHWCNAAGSPCIRTVDFVLDSTSQRRHLPVFQLTTVRFVCSCSLIVHDLQFVPLSLSSAQLLTLRNRVDSHRQSSSGSPFARFSLVIFTDKGLGLPPSSSQQHVDFLPNQLAKRGGVSMLIFNVVPKFLQCNGSLQLPACTIA